MVVVGLVLTVPALLALYRGYIGPTFWTVRSGFQDVDVLSGRIRDVGGRNYQVIGEDVLDTFGRALLFGVGPLLAFLVVAPLLALAAHWAGRAGRWVVRVAFAVPMVLGLAPATLAAGYFLDRLRPEDSAREAISNPATAPVLLIGFAGAATFGLVCGLGVTLFLAALRRREAGPPVWPGALVVAGLGVIAVLAAVLQTFVFPYVVTDGGPGHATTTPMLAIFDYGFRDLRFGTAAAAATVVLVPLALLGVAAAVLVIVSGLRVEFDPVARDDGPRGGSGGKGVVLALVGAGLVVVPFVAWIGIWPALSRIVGGSGAEQVPAESLGTIFANTWLPTLLSATGGVVVAALAGFAIGMLRPFGRYSEALLLPFAPWLFVGIGPLAIAHWYDAQRAEQLNSFAGLIPPVPVVIPALFVFTLFFKGQERRLREAGGAGGLGRAVLPVLPMVAVIGGVTWVVQAQDLLWPLLVSSDPDKYTGPLVLVNVIRQFVVADGGPIGVAFPIWAVVIAGVALAVAQVLYVDRLAIRAGR
ncbi:hypothetical protein AB0K60_31800 [Thermopolyspora sp. NPDC052614]|uniref:hypothetical protein n=1 Tax=Thermopolyspora sp. NPDC052614 TaxID=3155682 RepID=UPI0034152374